MSEKTLKTADRKNHLLFFLKVSSVFSLIFFIFFINFGSAQIGNSFFSGMTFDLSNDIEGTALDFQVLYTFDTSQDLVWVLSDNKVIYEFNITNNNEGVFKIDSMQFTGNTYNLSSDITSSHSITGFSVHGLGENIYISHSIPNSLTSRISRFTMPEFNLTGLTLSSTYNIPSNMCSSTPTAQVISSIDNFISPDGTSLFHLVRRSRTDASALSCLVQVNMATPFNLNTVTSTSQSSTGAFADNFPNMRLWMSSTKAWITFIPVFGGSTAEHNIFNFNAEELSTQQSSNSFEVNSIQSSQSPVNKFLFLGKNDNNLLVFNVIPQQIASPTPLNIGLNQETSRSFGAIFENYGFVRLSIIDLQTETLASIKNGENTTFTQFDSPKLFVSITGDNINFKTFFQEGTFSATMIVCVDSTETLCESDQFLINISSQITPPEPQNLPSIIQKIPNQNLLSDGNVTFNLNNYFSFPFILSDTKTFTVSYPDFTLNQNVFLQVNRDIVQSVSSSGDINVTLTALAGTGLLSIQSNGIDYNNPIQVCANNINGQVCQQFNLITTTKGAFIPPTTTAPSLIGGIAQLFPSADSLTFSQRMIYIFITMLITFIILFGIVIVIYMLISGSLTDRSHFPIAIILWILLFIYMIQFLFFISIGYIPMWIIFVALLILLVLAGLKFWSGNSGS